MNPHAFIPTKWVEHPFLYSSFMNSKADDYCERLFEKNMFVLSKKGKDFLDSIYEPRDLTCLHFNDDNPRARDSFTMGVAMSLGNAANNGRFEFEMFEVEYWTEQPIRKALAKVAKKRGSI